MSNANGNKRQRLISKLKAMFQAKQAGLAIGYVRPAEAEANCYG